MKKGLLPLLFCLSLCTVALASDEISESSVRFQKFAPLEVPNKPTPPAEGAVQIKGTVAQQMFELLKKDKRLTVDNKKSDLEESDRIVGQNIVCSSNKYFSTWKTGYSETSYQCSFLVDSEGKVSAFTF